MGLYLDLRGPRQFSRDGKIVVKPATVEVNIESIGNHLYIKVEGPKLYGMFVNTLTTEEFKGQDLTSKPVFGSNANTLSVKRNPKSNHPTTCDFVRQQRCSALW